MTACNSAVSRLNAVSMPLRCRRKTCMYLRRQLQVHHFVTGAPDRRTLNAVKSHAAL